MSVAAVAACVPSQGQVTALAGSKKAKNWLLHVAEYHHFFALAESNQVEWGPSPDNEQRMTDFFESKIGKKIAVPNLTSVEFGYVGGRIYPMIVEETVEELGAQAVAQLIFDDADRTPLSFCIKDKNPASDVKPKVHSFGTLTSLSWASNGYSLALVSELDDKILQKVYDRVEPFYASL